MMVNAPGAPPTLLLLLLLLQADSVRGFATHEHLLIGGGVRLTLLAQHQSHSCQLARFACRLVCGGWSTRVRIGGDACAAAGKFWERGVRRDVSTA